MKRITAKAFFWTDEYVGAGRYVHFWTRDPKERKRRGRRYWMRFRGQTKPDEDSQRNHR